MHIQIYYKLLYFTWVILYKIRSTYPYPEPVSVHWNAAEMPLVDPVYTGIPLENFVETTPHWKATGETLAMTAYTKHHWRDRNSPTHPGTYS